MVKRTKHILPNYHKVIEILTQKTSLSQSDIEKRIEQKYNRLGGVASKKACAIMVAEQLGVEVK